MELRRPAGMFDREHEWASLVRIAHGPTDAPRIGLVYGRRRLGKSHLLQALTDAFGGFYHQALEEERAPALAGFTAAAARFADIPGDGFSFRDWDAALRWVIDRARGRPIVLDEFPFLIAESRELPSVIQRLYDEARAGRTPAFCMLLCGSALSVMTRLLAGQQALRGRAMLDMLIRPFDFREARAFWGIEDADTAFLVHAIVGGAPGYRALLPGPGPRRAKDLAEWLAGGVLDPSHALFRETDYLLIEDPTITDRALYRSVTGAIAGGNATLSGVANALSRPATALAHPLATLERAGFIVREEDLLAQRRPRLRIADPLLRFGSTIIRPDLARFEARRAQEAWVAARSRFDSLVVGPHFETLARDWAFRYAGPTTLGGSAIRVGFTQVNDPAMRERFELDVVVDGTDAAGRRRILAIGEAKAGGRRLGINALARLERLRALLSTRTDAADARLLLFGRAGFARDLVAAARARGDVELVDLARLYEGD